MPAPVDDDTDLPSDDPYELPDEAQDALAATRPTNMERHMLRAWLDGKPFRFHDDKWSPSGGLPGRDADAEKAYGSHRDGDGPDAEEEVSEPVDVELPVHLRAGVRYSHPRYLTMGMGSVGKGARLEEFNRRFGAEIPHKGPRPATRGSCAEAIRPCPFVTCRHHLYLDVVPTGAIRLARPELEPEEIEPEWSCSLDVADRGAHTLDGVGRLLGLTRERIRQISDVALEKMRDAGGDLQGDLKKAG